MGVLHTPQGRVIGLILQQDQPKAQPETGKETDPKPSASTKRPGRPAKK